MASTLNQQNKQVLWEFWKQLETASDQELQSLTQQVMAPGMHWHGFAPLDSLRGPKRFLGQFWLPFRAAFSNPVRENHMFLGGISVGSEDGQSDEGMWVGGTGYFRGVFSQDWLGIPASGREVSIRWGELCQLQDCVITQVYVLFDLVDLLQQIGRPVLPPARGKDSLYPPPRNDNAIYLDQQDEDESQRTLDLIRKFIFESLNVYDRENLHSMGVADFFPPDIRWYGPGGIGACLSLEEFEDLHQRHWLHAFPDRAVQDLDCLFAEGAYTAGAGWGGVVATHAGQYLDAPASGKKISVTGLDFWRREDSKFTENWVFVDMIHLFRQFGIDLFERIK
jgi:predicted ester cyclase